MPVGLINPAEGLRNFVIKPTDRIASIGSCFAQHIATFLKSTNLEYLEVEVGERDSGYGVFSARYGNVYTTRQFIQLIRLAQSGDSQFGDIWEKDGRFFDSLRPTAIPQGFRSKDELIADRNVHYAAVGDLFREATVLILTLGLTEGWSNATTGQIYPVAPGVITGEYDPTLHKSFTSGIFEIIADLDEILNTFEGINPNLRIIFTVSPVPLMATHQDLHVITSSVSSKATLRTACDVIISKRENTYYFPSYEIITSLAQAGNYFQSNLRDVNNRGIQHVMRVFLGHFSEKNSENQFSISTRQDLLNFTALCDEDLLESTD